MPYATRADLEFRYGTEEVSLRESVLPAGALDRILQSVDAEIDAYLAGRYAIPLSPAPENVVNFAAAIARYRLLGEAASDHARTEYEDARAFLRDVQAGRARLDAAATVSGASPSEAVVITGRRRVFGGGLL